MTLGFEVALPLGAIAFYLYDSAMLVHGNELLFVRRGRIWHAVGGSDVVLLGKRVCLPAPLLPWCLVFRSFWSERTATTAAPATWPSAAFDKALVPLQVLSTILLALLLVALPLASLLLGSGSVLLGVFAGYYAVLLVALTCAFASRQALGLEGRAYWAVALDVFACAPFAVNLVRRITLRQSVPVDALTFSQAWLQARERRQATAFILVRVEEYLVTAPPGGTEAAALAALRARLAQELACAG